MTKRELEKKFSQIGPAVPELLSLTHTHTDRQTDIQRSYYFRVRIFQVFTPSLFITSGFATNKNVVTRDLAYQLGLEQSALF